MEKQQKIIEELQKIESFAEMLLEKCYSVRELMSLGGFHPRASLKKKSQSKINQVIANRNKTLRKSKNAMCLLLLLTVQMQAQSFQIPNYDSLKICIEQHYEQLTLSQVEEFQYQHKKRWLNYIPSPGYSPFTGGFTVSLNVSAPLQEAKFRNQVKQKIRAIQKTNELQMLSLLNEAKVQLLNLQYLIEEYKALDSLQELKELAFKLTATQYERNEITPSEFIARQIDIISFRTSRLSQSNHIQQQILELLIKCKCPAP